MRGSESLLGGVVVQMGRKDKDSSGDQRGLGGVR